MKVAHDLRKMANGMSKFGDSRHETLLRAADTIEKLARQKAAACKAADVYKRQLHEALEV